MERKPSARRRRPKKRWTEKCKDYFRNFLAFMFSNVGIIGLVVGYTVAGAFIFRAIEEEVLEIGQKTVNDTRYNVSLLLWKIVEQVNILDEVTWKRDVNRVLLMYEKNFTDLIWEGYDGTPAQEKMWSFPSAFLYSLTVITTIGYGNVVPKTDLGKAITIVYAIIGMPLFLLYLSNIGDIMARSFKWLYAKLCLCRCCPGVAKKREERRKKRVAELTVEYFSNQDEENPEVHIRRASLHEVYQDAPSELDTSETLSDASDDIQTVTVPLTVCLSIMVGYILSGTLLFCKYEGTWSVLDGSYFCFISLSTIGFGDFVPGKEIYSDAGFEVASILGSMYLMLGMALIAMCFNLMQEEVIHKIRSTARSVKYLFRCNR